jgi:hypothetical protein
VTYVFVSLTYSAGDRAQAQFRVPAAALERRSRNENSLRLRLPYFAQKFLVRNQYLQLGVSKSKKMAEHFPLAAFRCAQSLWQDESIGSGICFQGGLLLRSGVGDHLSADSF